MSSPDTRFTLCTTYEEAASAIVELSWDTPVILKCYGESLGMPEGTLSIITLSDASASRIFLFDVLALSDLHHPLITPLLSLLEGEDVMKIVWDGRCDSFEIADTYGTLLGGVLDLQIVEAAERRRHQHRRLDSSRWKHTLDYFKSMREELGEDPSVLDGVHRLYTPKECATALQVPIKPQEKDPEFASLSKTHGPGMWMIRPLPSSLIRYSALRIEVIAQLYAYFSGKRAAIWLPDVDVLKAISTRYIQAYPSRELRALHRPLGLVQFLPLEVLEASPGGGVSYTCARCASVLSLQSFSTKMRSGVRRRRTFCRLCVLLARRSKEAVAPKWVAVDDWD